MLAQTLCKDYHHNGGQPQCTIKLDMCKAFDSLDLSFIFGVLNHIGFLIALYNGLWSASLALCTQSK